MSLVNELIAKVVDSSTDLSEVLRKARVLASELRSEELGRWAEGELNGYNDEDVLPDYRVSIGSNFGNFVGYRTQGNGLPIALSNLPEDWRERMSKLKLSSGVASLQEMFRSEKNYQEEWPADAVALVSKDIYEEMNMVMAWKAIPKARIADVLDAVRNRLLSFLLELKVQHPEVETTEVNLQTIPKEDVRLNIVNNIFGGHNVFASGETVNQKVEQGVKLGDLVSLLSAFREEQVPEGLLDELSAAISDDKPVGKSGIGPKVSLWMAKAGEKVATNTFAAFAAQALAQYYGIAGT